MDAKRPHEQIHYYEGVVRKTAAICEPHVEDDFDEICQFLREKVWKALVAFSPARVKTTSKYTPAEQCERFVFACITNGKKDVLKKKKRNLLFIEDLAPGRGEAKPEWGAEPGDGFAKRYLSHEDAYPSIAEVPLIPSTLTADERTVVLSYYLGYSTAEIAEEHRMAPKDVLRTAATVREKMADWQPDTGVPMLLPVAA